MKRRNFISGLLSLLPLRFLTTKDTKEEPKLPKSQKCCGRSPFPGESIMNLKANGRNGHDGLNGQRPFTKEDVRTAKKILISAAKPIQSRAADAALLESLTNPEMVKALAEHGYEVDYESLVDWLRSGLVEPRRFCRPFQDPK